MVAEHEPGQSADNNCADQCADAAQIGDPFACRLTADVHDEKESEKCDGGDGRETGVGGEALNRGTEDVDGNAHTGEQNRRQVYDIGQPITPCGDEAVQVAE